MRYSYLSRLESVYDQKSFWRKLDYIKYNFGSIIDELKIKKDPSVLEVGPGKGEFVEYLRRSGIHNIDIIDRDKEILGALGKDSCVRNSFYSEDVISVKNKLRQYDLIVLIQVLEHVLPNMYPSIIKTLYSKLKKEGYILIVVPNANNPLGLIERYGDLEHQIAFTTQSLKDLVISSEITNDDFYIKGYSIPPYSLLNVTRIILQKILHTILFVLLIVNGGTYFNVMSPNIILIIRKRP